MAIAPVLPTSLNASSETTKTEALDIPISSTSGPISAEGSTSGKQDKLGINKKDNKHNKELEEAADVEEDEDVGVEGAVVQLTSLLLDDQLLCRAILKGYRH